MFKDLGRFLLSSGVTVCCMSVACADPIERLMPDEHALLQQFMESKEPERALAWLRPKVEEGNAEAVVFYWMLCDARFGSNCEGVDINSKLRQAAESRYAPAQYLLGVSVFQRAGARVGQGEGWNWIERAASQKYPAAMTALADRKIQRGIASEIAGAIELYRGAAERKDAQAHFKLGLLYEVGKGVPKDIGTAIEHYRAAAELGNSSGQNALGLAYLTGRGVAVDKGKAEELFRRAAKSNHTGAQYNLATMLLAQERPELHFFEARRLLEKAAEHGHIDAQDRLGTAYFKGEGVKRDLDAAERWYLKAAERGHVDAQYSLGVLYSERHLAKYNVSKALTWLEKAMERGNPDAYYLAGKIYYKDSDFAKAEALFAEAERLGGGTIGKERMRRVKEFTTSRRYVAEKKITSPEAAIAVILGLAIIAGAAASGDNADSPGHLSTGRGRHIFGFHSDPMMDHFIAQKVWLGW